MTEDQLLKLIHHIRRDRDTLAARIAQAITAIRDEIEGAEESRGRDSMLSQFISILEGTEHYP